MKKTINKNISYNYMHIVDLNLICKYSNHNFSFMFPINKNIFIESTRIKKKQRDKYWDWVHREQDDDWRNYWR